MKKIQKGCYYCDRDEGKLGWGRPFILFPDPKDRIYLTEEEYAQRMDLLRGALQAKLAE